MIPEPLTRAGWVMALSLAVAPSLTGQTWQLDAAGSTVRVDSLPAQASFGLSSQLEWARRGAYLLATAGYARFEGDSWSAQSAADLSLLFRRKRTPAFELALRGGGTAFAGGAWTATTAGELRAHLLRPAWGGWIGLAAGAGWTDLGGETATSWGPTGGAWFRHGPWTTTVTLARPEYRLGGALEATARLAWSSGRYEIAGQAGGRSALGAGLVRDAGWGGVTAAVWLSPHVALTAAGGNYPSDLLQSLSRGRYLSLGIRLASRRPTTWAQRPVGRPLTTDDRGTTEFRFHLPQWSTVAIAGDWTGWAPVPLHSDGDGWWRLTTVLPTGVHRFNLIVNGDRWIVPDGVAAVDDGFGGRVGLLVTP